MLLGLDTGSVVSKALLMDESFCVQGRWWHHSRGDPASAIKFLIEKAIGEVKKKQEK